LSTNDIQSHARESFMLVAIGWRSLVQTARISAI
jgi:hypothetical protein